MPSPGTCTSRQVRRGGMVYRMCNRGRCRRLNQLNAVHCVGCGYRFVAKAKPTVRRRGLAERIRRAEERMDFWLVATGKAMDRVKAYRAVLRRLRAAALHEPPPAARPSRALHIRD